MWYVVTTFQYVIVNSLWYAILCLQTLGRYFRGNLLQEPCDPVHWIYSFFMQYPEPLYDQVLVFPFIWKNTWEIFSTELIDLSQGYPFVSPYNNNICHPYDFIDIIIGFTMINFLVLGIIILVYLIYEKDILHYLRTRLVFHSASNISLDLRNHFKRAIATVNEPREPLAHSHPKSAQNRTRAVRIIDTFCNITRLRRYDYQPSLRDSWLPGTRTWHTAKDLMTTPKLNKMFSTDVFTMIDVDYYVSINHYLKGNYVFLYTFAPTNVAAVSEEYSYWFSEDNEINLKVSGGAQYKHPLWNYNVDHCLVKHWWGATSYLVESTMVSQTNRLVYFNPIRNIYGPASWFMKSEPIQRLIAVDNGLALSVSDGKVHFAPVGSTSEATVPIAAYTTAKTRCSLKEKVFIADIERVFNSYKVDEAAFAATVLFNYLTSWDVLPEPTSVIPDTHTYQATYPLITERGQAKMRQIAKPIIKAYSPAKSYNNDIRCVNSRVKEVFNNTPCPPEFRKYVDEFIDQVTEVLQCKHMLVPWSVDKYQQHLRTSTQKKKFEKYQYDLDVPDHVHVSSFQKTESYAKITDPRNISTFPTAHNAHLGQFVLAASETFVNLPWYGPGKHPKDTARRLADICCKSSSLVSSDGSRQDGSTSAFLRSVYESLMKNVFHPQYHNMLIKSLKAELDAKAHTVHGVKYSLNGSVGSGSSDTSQINTFVDAFICYSALRCELTSSGIITPLAAFELLGLYYSDDGVTPQLSATTLRYVASKFGMVFESEIVETGMPLKYLGRIYLDPWTTQTSIADVPRQLAKLHLTLCPDTVPREVILRRRAEAYKITDPNTPILSEWSDGVLRIAKIIDIKHYNLMASKEDSFWMQFEDPFLTPHYCDALPFVADSLKMTCDELCSYRDGLVEAKTLDELFLPISLAPVPIAFQAQVAGEVLQPTATKNRKDILQVNSSLKPPSLRPKVGKDKLKVEKTVPRPPKKQDNTRNNLVKKYYVPRAEVDRDHGVDAFIQSANKQHWIKDVPRKFGKQNLDFQIDLSKTPQFSSPPYSIPKDKFISHTGKPAPPRLFDNLNISTEQYLNPYTSSSSMSTVKETNTPKPGGRPERKTLSLLSQNIIDNNFSLLSIQDNGLKTKPPDNGET